MIFESGTGNKQADRSDEAGNVIETHNHAGDFKDWWRPLILVSVQYRLRCTFA